MQNMKHDKEKDLWQLKKKIAELHSYSRIIYKCIKG